MFGVSCEGVEGAAYSGKHRVVEPRLLRVGEAPQWLRQGEREHKVAYWEQLGLLRGGPLRLRLPAALQAGAVVAGVVGEVDFGAVATAVNLRAKRRGAAREDGVRGPVVGAGEQVAVGRGKARPVRREDGREVHDVIAAGGWCRVSFAVAGA